MGIMSEERASPRLRLWSVTIPTDADGLMDEGVDLTGYTLAGVLMPGTWTSGNLTFQASHEGTTFTNLYDSGGTEVTITAAASRYIVLSPEHLVAFAGVQKLKVRSGTSGSPAQQAGARTVYLIGRRIE